MATRRKLTDMQILDIYFRANKLKQGYPYGRKDTYLSIADEYGISRSMVEQIKNGSKHNNITANAELIAKAPTMYDQLASARAIMQKFVDKVERGMAKSIETYAEMKQWMEDE